LIRTHPDTCNTSTSVHLRYCFLWFTRHVPVRIVL
jgi:hypothetical protein